MAANAQPAAEPAAPPPRPEVVAILRDKQPAPEVDRQAFMRPEKGVTRPGGRQPSMNPEAVRARKRREAARKAAGPAPSDEAGRTVEFRPPPPAGTKFGPALVREISTLPDGPAGPSPDQVSRAVGLVEMVIRAAGVVAAAVFKDDRMKVPDQDATQAAQLILDGWPELATGASGDAKKGLALACVGSLAVERYYFYRETAQRQGTERATGPLTPSQQQAAAAFDHVGEMAPVSIG